MIHSFVLKIKNLFMSLFIRFLNRRKIDTIDIAEVIFVYDRMNESSLLAACLLKEYGHFQVVEYEDAGQIKVSENTELCWLGFQPVKTILQKTICKHIAFVGNIPSKPTWFTIKIRGGQYESLVSQVIYELLLPMQSEDSPSTKVIEQWIGVGYLVENFNKKWATQEMLIKAFAVIKMCFEYLSYETSWNPGVLNDDGSEEAEQEKNIQLLDYRQAVEESKQLLKKNVQTRYSFERDRIIATQYIKNTDHRWYVMKRLVTINGQVWKSPLIIDDKLYYSNNDKKSLAA